MVGGWRCLVCGANADDPRPFWCPRCGAVSSYGRVVHSPAMAPPQRRPVKASDLGGGKLAPSLGRWDDLFGRVGRPIKLLVFGPPGSLKTTCALLLSEAFKVWGPVLYVAADEGPESQSFKDKIGRLEVLSPYIMSGSWAEISAEVAGGGWSLVVLDSANRIGVVPGELDAYTNSLRLSWLVLLEVTKAGDFRGDASWPHWADIVLYTDGKCVNVEKSRYGQAGKKQEVLCV